MKIMISKFVPVSNDYIELIRKWRNTPRIRDNMLDDTIISPDQQRLWFDGLHRHNDKEYRIFFQNDRPIGMLYFSNIGDSSCEWGCYIGEEDVWPGSGLIIEIASLDYAFESLGVSTLKAEVFENNKSPINMHRFFQYQVSSEIISKSSRSGCSRTILSFRYERKQWLSNRAQVLSKLPLQIQKAAKHIYFS